MTRQWLIGLAALALSSCGPRGACPGVPDAIKGLVKAGTYRASAASTWCPDGGDYSCSEPHGVVVISDDLSTVTETFTRGGKSYVVHYRATGTYYDSGWWNN